MDFSRVQLSDEDQAFHDEARNFLATHMTEEVRRRDRETGDNFDEGLHLAFGAAGYLAREWKPAVRRRLQPGTAADLGAGEAAGARAMGDLGDHRHGRAVGGQVRLARTAGKR